MKPDKKNPNRQVTDREFEEMVTEAEGLTCRAKHHCRVNRKRFGLIRTFQVPLAEVTLAELVSHLEYVVALAKPRPR